MRKFLNVFSLLEGANIESKETKKALLADDESLKGFGKIDQCAEDGLGGMMYGGQRSRCKRVRRVEIKSSLSVCARQHN